MNLTKDFDLKKVYISSARTSKIVENVQKSGKDIEPVISPIITIPRFRSISEVLSYNIFLQKLVFEKYSGKLDFSNVSHSFQNIETIQVGVEDQKIDQIFFRSLEYFFQNPELVQRHQGISIDQENKKILVYKLPDQNFEFLYKILSYILTQLVDIPNWEKVDKINLEQFEKY